MFSERVRRSGKRKGKSHRKMRQANKKIDINRLPEKRAAARLTPSAEAAFKPRLFSNPIKRNSKKQFTC